MHSCDLCDSTFTRAFDLKRHKIRKHSSATATYSCLLCGLSFNDLTKLKDHRKLHQISSGNKFEESQQAFNGAAFTYSKLVNKQGNDVKSLLLLSNSDLVELLKHKQETMYAFKCQLILTVCFKKTDPTGESVDETGIIFRTLAYEILRSDDLDCVFEKFEHELEKKVENFCANGSGWVIEDFQKLEVNIGAVTPLRGACGFLPPIISSPGDLENFKQSTANLNDTKCFYIALAAYFVASEKEEDLEKFARTNFRGMENGKSVAVKNIALFEKRNQHLKIRINVITMEKVKKNVLLFPVYSSKFVHPTSVTLFLFQTGLGESLFQHYFLVKDLSIFTRKVYENQLGMRSYQKRQICGNCLCDIGVTGDMNFHLQKCLRNEPQHLAFSFEEITFKAFNKKFPMEYIIFWDTEACMDKDVICSKCDGKCICGKNTVDLNKQVPISYSLLVLDKAKNILHKNTYTGEDCMAKFVDEVLLIQKQLMKRLTTYNPMQITKAEQEEFERAKTCWICDRKLFGDAVRDHDHVTGRYIGAAHNSCNINRNVCKKILVVAHGFSNYDSHHLIKYLSESGRRDIGQISILPYNSERIRTLEFKNLKFVDSFAFFNASLDSLAKDLTSSNHDFNILKAYGLTESDEKMKLLLNKSFFPYEFATSIQVLKNNSLPAHEHFFSKIKNSNISSEEYNHAKKVYDSFEMKNMLEYMELYEKLDVVLLAEVFMNFRDMVLEEWKLDCW